MILIILVKLITFRLLEQQLPCLKSNSVQAVAIALPTGEDFLELNKKTLQMSYVRESGCLDMSGEDGEDGSDDEDNCEDNICEDVCRESDDCFVDVEVCDLNGKKCVSNEA